MDDRKILPRFHLDYQQSKGVYFNNRKVNTYNSPFTDETMDVPNAIYAECPFCGEETRHRVVKGKFSDKKMLILEAIVKCTECQNAHPILIKEEKPVIVPLILSKMNTSTKKNIELPSREIVKLGCEYFLDGVKISITAIEGAEKRVDSAPVQDIRTLWAKEIERIQIGISINDGSRTFSRKITAVPDEEFFIGDVLTIKGSNVAIHRIKTYARSIKKGSAIAKNIVRLYCKRVK